VSLVDPKGFSRHFIHEEKDAFQLLLETQKEMQKPIYIVPQLVLYKKTPEKEYSTLTDILFGYRDNPGIIRKIVLFFRHNRRAFIDFGRPLDLKGYLDGQPADRPLGEMSREIRPLLIDSIDAQKRIILGPIMKSRQQHKEDVLKDPRVIRTIEEMAGKQPKREKQFRKKAEAYFDEIAADYNIGYIQFFHMTLTWLWKKIFEGIDVEDSQVAVMREWARKGPLIYVPSHKSHIDYLVLNYVLFLYHMHIPRIVAGKNLLFWPMGHIFRKSGAFFIRRSFKGARLYAEVFERYVKSLLEEGHPIEFFIEGGRSRSGKLILPKMGFLSILLQAHQEGYCDDLVFVPSSIIYDRILEEGSYLREVGGGQKKEEDFKQFLKTRHFLKRKYGKIYIRFGEPVSLKEYLGAPEDLGKDAHQDLAFHLIKSINRVTLVTPLALVALAILTKHRQGFLLEELNATAEILLQFIRDQQIPTATTLDNLSTSLEETLSLLINRRVVSVMEDVDGAETFYYVDEEKKKELEYYKNSIIHWFVSYAFVAVSLLTGTEAIRSTEEIIDDYDFMKRLFKKEFIYDEPKDNRTEVDRAITYFRELEFIEAADGRGYKPTRLGFDRLRIWAALAKTFLESYWIATRSFIHREQKSAKGNDLLKTMNYLGVRYHKMGLIDHVEAISQLNYRNAITYIHKTIPYPSTDSQNGHEDASNRLSQISQRIYELSHYRA
jgi:glycerol-3-phosphate O-acyltransferase